MRTSAFRVKMAVQARLVFLRVVFLAALVGIAEGASARLFINSPALRDGVPAPTLETELRAQLEAIAAMPENRLRAQVKELGRGFALYVNGNSGDYDAIEQVLQEGKVCFHLFHNDQTYAFVSDISHFDRDADPDGDSITLESTTVTVKAATDGYSQGDVIAAGLSAYFFTLLAGLGCVYLYSRCFNNDGSSRTSTKESKDSGNTSDVDGFQPFHTANPLHRSTGEATIQATNM
eukprot:m.161314 g.161314  ORF g.161314 m.161314 type:complete len:234 (+) comp16525_c0_seq1:2490-3191(+)